jgi:hypothetical protein
MKKIFFYCSILITVFSCNTYPYTYHIGPVENITANKKIAILPSNFIVQGEISKIERVNSMITDSLERRFKKYKFEVIGVSQFGKEIDSIKASYGGFFDTNTGKADTVKVKDFHKKTTAFIINKYRVTSILYPYLTVTKAIVENSGIRWHGRSRYVPGNIKGSVPALSLYIEIFDTKEKLIFDNAGGIQPLSKIDYFANTKSVNKDEILKDPADLHEALEIIFQPILQKLKPIYTPDGI